MRFVFNLIRKVLKIFGLTIKRIPPAIDKSKYSLYDFFAFNNEEAETFMQFVYSLMVKEGDVVLDVGANHGLHTVPLSRLVGKDGQVLAFEAIADNNSDIKSRLLLNNVKFFNVAVTKPQILQKQKTIEFIQYPTYLDGFSGLKGSAELEGEGKVITVPTATIDQVVADQKLKAGKHIPFMKIDVEGGDFDALLGAEKTLKKYKPVVIMENKRQESADLYGYDKNSFFKYIESLGYSAFQFTGNSFTKKDWDAEKVYWETWLVHKDSDVLNFFKNHCENFAKIFISDKRA